MVGTGCSGTNAFRYGTMRANVVSLTAVLADGSVVRTGARARKTSAGYDLTSLLVGSEGTLALVTEATLRLHPIPAHTAVAVCSFPSVRAACDAVLAVTLAGVQVGAVELLDAPAIAAVNAQAGFTYPPAPHLFFKFSGGSTARVAADAEAAQACVAAAGGSSFAWTADAAGQARLWGARKEALWSVAAQDPGRRVATTDVCVPVSRLPDLMAAMEAHVAEAAAPDAGGDSGGGPPRRPHLSVAAVAHAGDGNAHHFLLFDPADPAEAAEAKGLSAFLVHAAQAMGGTCTGEHGVGVGKTQYLEAEYGAEGLAAMRAIKAALDPSGIMNPGKKLPAPPEAHSGGGGRADATSGPKAAAQSPLSTTSAPAAVLRRRSPGAWEGRAGGGGGGFPAAPLK